MTYRPRKVDGDAQRYGHHHRARRKQLDPVVQRGDGWCAELICLMPTRWITPGTPWHLAHDSPTTYRGPAHRRCNEAEAARRGNRTRHGRAPASPWSTSRTW